MDLENRIDIELEDVEVPISMPVFRTDPILKISQPLIGESHFER